MDLEHKYYSRDDKSSDESEVYLLKLNNTDSASFHQDTISSDTIKARIYWLAANLVSQWRSLPAEKYDLSTIFQSLSPELKEVKPEFILTSSLLLNSLAVSSKKSYTSFLAELDRNFQENFIKSFKYFNNKEVVKWLAPAIADVTNFLTESTQKCLQELEINFELVETKAHEYLEVHFYFLRSSGTDAVINYLIDLIQELDKIIKDYESQCQKYEDLIKSSNRCFQNLSSHLSRWWQPNKKQKADSALNALFLSYKLRLELQTFSAGCQVLKKVKLQVEQYTNIVSTIDRWLSELQEWFNLQYPLEPVNPTLLKDLSYRIDPIKFKKEIEDWAELQLYEWNSLDEIKTIHLKEQILIRVQQVCWEHYTESLLIKEKLSNRNFLKILEG